MFKYFLFGILGAIFAIVDYAGSAIVGQHAGKIESLLLVLAYVGVICFLLSKDNPEKFAYVLILPAFIALGLNIIYVFVSYGFLTLTPDSKVFTDECSKTEVKYIKLPTKPVHSIAYDWDSEEAPSFINYQITNGTRISGLSYSSKPYVNDQHIDFVEIKPTSNFGTPSLGAGSKYLRFPKHEIYWGVAEITADVLVKYKTSPIEQSRKDGALRYELTVSDRRNGDKLAYLRYVVDVKKQRACGLRGAGRVSDGQFIQKAIGV